MIILPLIPTSWDCRCLRLCQFPCETTFLKAEERERQNTHALLFPTHLAKSRKHEIPETLLKQSRKKSQERG